MRIDLTKATLLELRTKLASSSLQHSLHGHYQPINIHVSTTRYLKSVHYFEGKHRETGCVYGLLTHKVSKSE